MTVSYFLFGKISQTQLTILSFIREMNVVNNVVNPFIYGFFDHVPIVAWKPWKPVSVSDTQSLMSGAVFISVVFTQELTLNLTTFLLYFLSFLAFSCLQIVLPMPIFKIVNATMRAIELADANMIYM
jgi:hypothetical protein